MKYAEYQIYFDKCVDRNIKAELPNKMFSDWQEQHDLFNDIAHDMQDKLEKEYRGLELKEIQDYAATIDSLTRKAMNIMTMYLQIVNKIKEYNLGLEAPTLVGTVKTLKQEVEELKKLHEKPKQASISEDKQKS